MIVTTSGIFFDNRKNERILDHRGDDNAPDDSTGAIANDVDLLTAAPSP